MGKEIERAKCSVEPYRFAVSCLCSETEPKLSMKRNPSQTKESVLKIAGGAEGPSVGIVICSWHGGCSWSNFGDGVA